MVKKYKLTKDLPDLKAGAIFNWNEEMLYYYNKQNMKKTDWFTPYVFTTSDKVDIFEGDKYFYVEYTGDDAYNIKAALGYGHGENPTTKYFSTRNLAEEYLNTKVSPKKHNWYYAQQGRILLYYTQESDNTGWDGYGEWSNTIGTGGKDNGSWKLAPIEEVKKRLLEEAHKRYPIGTEFTSLFGKETTVQSLAILSESNFKRNELDLYVNNGYHLIFELSLLRWAEIKQVEKPILITQQKASIYAKDLIHGNIYYSNNFPHFTKQEHIFKFDKLNENITECRRSLSITRHEYITFTFLNNAHLENLRPATKKEMKWLKECAKQGAFIPEGRKAFKSKKQLYLGNERIGVYDTKVATKSDSIQREVAISAINKINQCVELGLNYFSFGLTDDWKVIYNGPEDIKIGCIVDVTIKQINKLSKRLKCN